MYSPGPGLHPWTFWTWPGTWTWTWAWQQRKIKNNILHSTIDDASWHIIWMTSVYNIIKVHLSLPCLCRLSVGQARAGGYIPMVGAGSFNQHLAPCFTNLDRADLGAVWPGLAGAGLHWYITAMVIKDYNGNSTFKTRMQFFFYHWSLPEEGNKKIYFYRSKYN